MLINSRSAAIQMIGTRTLFFEHLFFVAPLSFNPANRISREEG